MALGAGSAQVLRGVIVDALALIALGLGIGCGAAALLGRLVSSLLYGVSATNPAVYAAAAAVLMLVGAAAAFLPARRASRVDPIEALRYD